VYAGAARAFRFNIRLYAVCVTRMQYEQDIRRIKSVTAVTRCVVPRLLVLRRFKLLGILYIWWWPCIALCIC
jgi:hypothetical protein